MADHGALTNQRRYWTWTDAQGKPQVSDTAPVGGSAGILGTGILGSKAPAATEYEERTYEDGTKVVSRFDPEKTQWVQESVDVDPSISAQHRGVVADTKAATAQTAQAEIDKQRLDLERQRIANEQANAAQRAAQEQAAGQRAEKRELTMAEYQQQHLAFEKEVQAGRMSADQARAAEDRWFKERMLEHQAAQEARANRTENRQAAAQEASNAIAAGHLGIAARGATVQEQQLARQTLVDERLANQQAQNLQFNQQKAGLDFGQNRVQNALATMPYRVGPGFASNFAQGLSTLSGGGGQVNFNPSDFQVQIPNQDQMMEEGFRRAMAIFGVSPPAVAPNAPGGPLPLPPAYPSMPR